MPDVKYTVVTPVAMPAEDVLAYLSVPGNHANLKTSLSVDKVDEPNADGATHVVFVDKSAIMGCVPYVARIYCSFRTTQDTVFIEASSAGLRLHHGKHRAWRTHAAR